jgi:hypothetical protein
MAIHSYSVVQISLTASFLRGFQKLIRFQTLKRSQTQTLTDDLNDHWKATILKTFLSRAIQET